MNEHLDDDHLSDLLERASRHTEVGAPPLAVLTRDAAGVRRRRATSVVVAAAAAVVLVAGATAVLPSPGGEKPGSTADPTTADPVRPAVGERLVGLGRVAVTVPAGWATNATRCGISQRDTVVIDVIGVDLCLTTRPAGVESVEIIPSVPSFDNYGNGGGETVELDGVAARRSATRCRSSDERSLCSAWLYVPSEAVEVRAESSSGPDEVDRILDGVRILPDRLGVPGFSRIVDRSPQGGSGERYADLLTRSGLRAVTRGVSRPRLPPGYVLSAEPAPGTVVEPGTAVVVTVVADR